MSENGETFDNGDAFETSAMKTVIESATIPAPPLNAADSMAKVKEHGWVERTAYDYKKFSDDRETREAEVVDEAGQPALIEGADWLSSAMRYEWDDEYGDVGPKIPRLEEELFGKTFRQETGSYLDAYDLKVTVEGDNRPPPIISFEDAGLHPVMLENVKLCGYNKPTPIQGYVIPAVLTGNDVVGCAQTGSGKTAAYLIPVLSRLMGKGRKLAAPRPLKKDWTDSNKVRAEPLAVIVCPTRELACQIFDEARRLCYRTQLRPCVIYGGVPTREHMNEIQRGCDILIATPGRLMDFMDRPNVLSMNRVKYTIIDEADELLHPDWEREMSLIMSGGDTNEDADHLYMMFSATFPAAARKLAMTFMADDYVRVRIGRTGSTHTNIKQAICYIAKEHKRDALFDLLLSMPPSRTLIFVNSVRMADMLDDFLYNKGLPSTSMHSGRTQKEREDAIRAFRMAQTPIMVATGVSARGLDIKHVMHVINFDLPSAAHGGIQEYIHRIGRTARIGNEGLATSFYNEDNEDIAEDLCKVMLEAKQPIPDFLEGRIDETASIHWDDNSDNEELPGTGGAADADEVVDPWGDAPVVAVVAPADTGSAGDGGFTIDENAIAW
ncbi:DEAD-box protein [Pseudovirgaria hyperparasitica]|uniref:RNA helicase n=1 Tax=Pseudovirgaria hyperparasitica TaxID=470096 RepID=A0A6A6W6R1_9PEZI|nr:DEAD-box protein [Pseudovirgaria hyperparasitica]KAF2757596.1 DEAD-box protein [Pseudovirgaria hyperparasitica]